MVSPDGLGKWVDADQRNPNLCKRIVQARCADQGQRLRVSLPHDGALGCQGARSSQIERPFPFSER